MRSSAGTNGAITLAGIAGLTFSVGDGVADGTMTFTGSAAAVNAALDGLSFMPSAGFSGAADLSISVNDQGNTGAEGRFLIRTLWRLTFCRTLHRR